MIWAVVYFVVLAAAVLLIPFIQVKWKGIITASAVLINTALGVTLALNVLTAERMEFIFGGTLVTGEVAIRIDALSGWFILLINFTLATGALYGLQYMKSYKDQSSNISLHCVTYLLVQSTLTFICTVQNALVFLVAWEVMAISAALLVIFEHYEHSTIKAGINYLIQSHLGIVFLSLGFIWVASRMNSFDFNAITQFSTGHSSLAGILLFFCFFIGFVFKAGFVPFHTWLPYAHPAAPSHISAIMSGVIIKIGIYGILRMILLVNTDYEVLGYIILTLSVFSGIYGVLLAIVQHNLKKLLAYHSIENIGIIGMGIGLGTIGMGTHNLLLTTLGFAGGMLHVLNHSLFKSLLFYGAGNIYRATHTMNIESLGGIIKKMPHTSLLFLAAALAICGLPPFNGFVSEFLIYSGLFHQISNSNWVSSLMMLSSVFGLVLIGGLAMLCFAKAFGTVFLGVPRRQFQYPPTEAVIGTLIPMYAAMAVMLMIGIFPGFFLWLLTGALQLFTDRINVSGAPYYLNSGIAQLMQTIGWNAIGFVALSVLVFLVRKVLTSQRAKVISSTWGCGYVGNTSKMQYSASSFVRNYRKLVEPVFIIHKQKKEIKGIFPLEGHHETHPYDKIEAWLIDIPIMQAKHFLGRFRFLQNGSTQYYILYGVIFMMMVMGFPYLYDKIRVLIDFFNAL